MYKQSILILLFTCSVFDTLGQNAKGLTDLFYGLPINSSKVILEKIKEDTRFKEIGEKDNSYISVAGQCYLGKISARNFADSIPNADSVTIEVTFGYGMLKQKRKYSKGHSLTFLKVKYFFSAKKDAQNTFDYFWSIVKANAKDTFETNVGYRNNRDFLYGKTAKLHKKNYLPKISVLQNDYSQNQYSILIEFERKED